MGRDHVLSWYITSEHLLQYKRYDNILLKLEPELTRPVTHISSELIGRSLVGPNQSQINQGQESSISLNIDGRFPVDQGNENQVPPHSGPIKGRVIRRDHQIRRILQSDFGKNNIHSYHIPLNSTDIHSETNRNILI